MEERVCMYARDRFSISWFTLQKVVTASLGRAEARIQEIHPGLPSWYQGSKELKHLLPFSDYEQEAD